MRLNVAAKPSVRTHEGAPAMVRQSAKLELLRAVGSCLLFENAFYETGADIAARIASAAQRVEPDFLADLARDARCRLNLRHVALWLAVQAMRRSDVPGKSGLVADVIQRADELAEIIALYWRQNPAVREVLRADGSVTHKHAPLPSAMKRGIAQAFQKFNEYQLAKYDRANEIKLRDALFLSHARPKDKAQARLWKRLIEGKLATPDTWEVALSAGADKKATFERLLRERKLGALALIRNLRNMEQAGVAEGLVRAALEDADPGRLLPFQFVAAAREAPRYESALEELMLRDLAASPQLRGKTVLVIDVSGSMGGSLSSRSTLNRIDAAAALAILCREVCEDVRIYATAGSDRTRVHATAALPDRHGFALRDALWKAAQELGGGGIFLVQCMRAIADRDQHAERVVVFTDEQDCDLKANPRTAPALGRYNYLVNVASYSPALDLDSGWMRINGFSERVVDFIRWHEEVEEAQN